MAITTDSRYLIDSMASAAQEEFNQLMRNKERRSHHPEDDDARSFLNLSDDDDDDDRTPPASNADPDDDLPRASTSSARHIIPRTRYGANTGPKGVISDAQHYRDSQRVHRTSLRSSSTLPRQIEQTFWSREQPVIEKQADSDEDDLDDEGADGDFMDKWRQSRLRELQSGGYGSKMHSRGKSRRLYGGMPTVDGEGYLEAVEKSPSDTVVIVYIYDDMVSLSLLTVVTTTLLIVKQSQVSHSIESCLLTLAQKHQDVRFVKLHYQDAEMEPAGVPALIAYRGGDKFAGLVPIMDEIPDDADFNALTLEAVLRRYVCLL